MPNLKPWLRGSTAPAPKPEPLPGDRRRAALAELAAVDVDEEAKLPGLLETVGRLEAAHDRALKAADRARAELRQAIFAERSARASLDHRRRRAEGVLRQTASPEIGEFINGLKTELRRVELGGRRSTSTPSGYRQADGRPHTLTVSDHASTVARAAGIRAAIKSAESLKIRDLTEDELGVELQSLWAELPAVKVETEAMPTVAG